MNGLPDSDSLPYIHFSEKFLKNGIAKQGYPVIFYSQEQLTMKKRIFVTLLALVLAVSMCIPMLPHSADAISSISDLPVFVLHFEDETTYIQTTAFLLRDEAEPDYMYLVTTASVASLLDSGYGAALIFPDNSSTPVTYITSSGNLAFLYAEGVSKYMPFLLGNSVGSKATMYHQTVKNGNVQKNKLDTTTLNLSSWTKYSSDLRISNTYLSSALEMGAPVIDNTSGKVVGCTVSANQGYLAAHLITGISLPKSASIESREGRSSSSNTTGSGSSNIVSGSYSRTKFYRSNRSTYPFVFDSPLYSCYGFTLNYKITEVTKGNMKSNFKYGIYVHTTSGTWKCVRECYLDNDLDTTLRITWNSPMTIDQVAVVCLKNENYSYTSSMTITDPICR